MRLRRLLPLLALAGCAQTTAPEATAPQRVAVFAPAAAEVLDALDLDDRVVGRGAFGDWPASMRDAPVVGSFDRPDVERLLELGVEMVLTAESVAAEDGHRRLRQVGIDVEPLDTSTFEGVFVSLARIGELFGRTERTDEMARRMRAELDEVRASTERLDRPRVLVVVATEPLFVAGPGSHIDELIAIGGGVNLADDAAAPYQRFSLETVLERRPEVIVDLSGNAASWSRWPFLPAVAENRVYAPEHARLSVPGVRLPQMARLMAGLIHPELRETAGDGP